MKITKTKALFSLRMFIVFLLAWAASAQAQNSAQENLINVKKLTVEYASKAHEQETLKTNLLEFIALDEQNIELLKTEEQRYIEDGETARALAIRARLIKYDYDYRDKHIELELYNGLITVFDKDKLIAGQIFTRYENAWFVDSATVDALNSEYNQLLQANYDAIMQLYGQAAAQRVVLSEQAGNEAVPEGIEVLLEAADKSAQAARYSALRQQYYKDVTSQVDGLNAGWGMTASARLLNKQARNYDLMAQVFENLNQWVGQSYSQLADKYSTEESTQAISQFYQQRATVGETTAGKLHAIASGLKSQAKNALVLGATFNANAQEFDLSRLFGFSINANETLATVFASMSEQEYWQSLYQQARNEIEIKIEENLASALEFKTLLAQAAEYEVEYERLTNDENGIVRFTDIQGPTQTPTIPQPTISTVPNQGSEGYYVGSIAGDIEVGGNGQPSWNMPISMPPGVRGIAPQLALSVHSGGAVEVSGLAAITRCPSTIAANEAARPVDFSLEDQLCMNGKALVLIQGQYGLAGSEYRTRLESFETVLAQGVSGNGPLSFVVTTRNGDKLYYGSTPQSQVRLAGNSTISAWQLSQFVDVAGNSIFYSYTDLSPQQGLNEYLLTEVLYGGKSEAASSLRVKFEYEPRPDTFLAYQSGARISSTQRLKKLTTSAANQIRRQYTLTYSQGEISKSSKLASIVECAGEVSPCYRPSYFTYAPEVSGWSVSSMTQPAALQNKLGKPRGELLDINNDGLNDWIIAVKDDTGNTEVATWLASQSGKWTNSVDFKLPVVLYDYLMDKDGIPVSQLIDINADGLTDVIQSYADGTSAENKVWLNTGQGFALTNFKLPLKLFQIDGDGKTVAFGQFVDVNVDGRVDVFVATKDGSGTEHRQTWLNTSTGDTVAWQLSDDFVPPTILLDYQANESGMSRGELLDINADGFIDIVVSVSTKAGINQAVYLNNGSGWYKDTQYLFPVVINDYSSNPKGDIKAQFADINGDGLLDIWQAIKRRDGGFVSNAWLNTGKEFSHAPHYAPPWYSIRHRSDEYVDVVGTHADLDSDGHPEFVVYYRSQDNITSLNIWKHGASGWLSARDELASKLPPVPFFQHFTHKNSTDLLQFADIDGDAMPEAFTSIQAVANGMKTFARPSLSPGEQPGMMVEMINGLKVATRLDYGLSTDADIYTPSTIKAQYPEINVNVPVVLTKTVHKMDGLLHPDSINTTPGTQGWYSIHHKYSGLRANLVGYGNLGYESRIINDNRTANEIKTQFNQQWPFIGLVNHSSTHANGLLQGESSTDHQYRLLNNNKTIYPYTSQTTALLYDKGKLISTSTKKMQRDDFGNLTHEQMQVVGSNNESVEKTITSEYQNDTQKWMLGLQVKKTQTLKKNDTDTIVNTIQRQFNDNGYPLSEVIEPGHNNALTTTYGYDGFGNVIQVKVSGHNQSRVTRSNYTSDGRFLASVTNPLGYVTQMEYALASGKLLRQTNANGITKETVYNAFDAVIKEQVIREQAPGQREIVLPYWCESTTTPACPETALYFVAALDDQGESPQVVYYDAYAREILKKSTGWDKQTIYQASRYDSLGRKVASSQPGVDLDDLNWTVSEFDSKDRIIKQTSPQGAKLTYEYNAYSKSIINQGGQKTTIITGIQGKPLKSIDSAGSTTAYIYDAEGRLLTTVDPAGNKIQTRYDLFGRKLSMDDPDMGRWTYEYDDFGNLTKQIDAKGQITSMAYDVLNRLIKRTESEGTTEWTYDTASLGDFGQAKGMLHFVSGPQGYHRSHFYDQFGRPVREETMIKGKAYTTKRGY